MGILARWCGARVAAGVEPGWQLEWSQGGRFIVGCVETIFITASCGEGVGVAWTTLPPQKNKKKTSPPHPPCTSLGWSAAMEATMKPPILLPTTTTGRLTTSTTKSTRKLVQRSCNQRGCSHRLTSRCLHIYFQMTSK
jgi:hypothetical protein